MIKLPWVESIESKMVACRLPDHVVAEVVGAFVESGVNFSADRTPKIAMVSGGAFQAQWEVHGRRLDIVVADGGDAVMMFRCGHSAPGDWWPVKWFASGQVHGSQNVEELFTWLNGW